MVVSNKGCIFAIELKTNIMSKNKNLHSAKKEKNDEFYTLYEDVEKEVEEYKEQLKDKIIFCNCDDPESSNFWKYLSNNFTYYNLKKLISSHYDPNGNSYKLEISRDINEDGNIDKLDTQKIPFKGNGDFRSEESIEILKEADIVITNPPFSCYSFDTEVLTNHGWKYIKDVDISIDLIYSLNPNTNKIEIVKVIDFISSPVNGKLYHYHSHNMDFMVTGNHKMFTYYKDVNGNNRYKGMIEADKLKKSNLLKLSGFSWSGKHNDTFILPSTIKKEQYTRHDIIEEEKHIDMKLWCEFFGFYLADGSVRMTKNNMGNERYVVSIKQNKCNDEYVKTLYKNIGFECKVYKNKSGNNNYEVYSKQLWEYLKQFGKSEDKFVPRELLELDNVYLKSFFTGYINGDSHAGNNDIILSSKSKKLMDNLQEIILKLYGQISKVRKVDAIYNDKPYNYYMISLNRNIKHRDFAKYGVPDMVNYNDNVYCLTLEKNHIMLVRHNGTIGWCGNCFREYIAQLMEYDKKFLIIGNLNAITYKEVFKYIKENKLWLGHSIHSGDREFQVPDSYPLNSAGYRIDEKGNKYIRVKGVRWFTNLDNKKRHIDLIRDVLYKKYTPEEYHKYINYDAINVDKTNDIPVDYFGYMGVPITYIDKHNPDQFEIIDINPHFFTIVEQGLPKPKQLKLEGRKDPYARIIIKRK